MSHVQSNLENLLRPSEHVLVTIPCRVKKDTSGLNFVKCEAALVANGSLGDEEAAFLAIWEVKPTLLRLFSEGLTSLIVVPTSEKTAVSKALLCLWNKVAAGMNAPVVTRKIERAICSIFIFNRSSKHPLQILYIIPINRLFKHSLLQTPPSPSTSFFHQSAPPYITLSLSSGDVRHELKIASSHTIMVQNLVRHLRQLSEATYDSLTPYTLTHQWTGLYPISSDQGDDEANINTADTAAVSPLESSTSLNTPLSSITTSLSAASIATNDSFFTVSQGSTSYEGSPNPYAPNFSKNSFLRKRLFSRETNWSTRQSLKIRLASYNVNDKLPPAGTNELAPLVGNGEDDLLVFGFQEVDLRSQALLISLGTNRAEAWQSALFKGLGDKADDFEKLAMTQYVGVMTIVLIRKTLRPAVTRVETSEKGIGLLGFGGNKAGVAVRIKIHDHTLTFVNSHLAAFATALDRRRTDYATLLRGLTFPRPSQSDVPAAFEEFLPEQKDRVSSLEEGNALFWLGDLNYRIDMEDEKLNALVKWKRWEAILEKDQLRDDIATGKSFEGFKEASIDFPPTFKYVIGSTTLDTRRPAAYTDRILYSVASDSSTLTSLPTPLTPMSPPTIPRLLRPLTPTNVEVSNYSSHEILWSDHRPVSASAKVDVRVVDVEKRKAELDVIQGELDKLEEEWAPALEINSNELDFGEIKYRSSVVREVLVRNQGRVPAMFSFRPPPGRPICKPFIWPFPSAGTVPQGGELKLSVSIYVDERWSERLTLGEEDINDVLVLQVKGGKDTYITLEGCFAPTIVGLPLSLLAEIPLSIRSMSLKERRELVAGETETLESEGVKVETSFSLSTDEDNQKEETGPAEYTKIAQEAEETSKTSNDPASPRENEQKGTAELIETVSIIDNDRLADGSEAVDSGDEEVKDIVTAPVHQDSSESKENEISGQKRTDAAGVSHDLASAGSTETLQNDELSSEPGNAGGPTKKADKVTRPAKAIWRLLEYLMEKGSGVERLWTEDVSFDRILDVVECLDTGSAFENFKPAIVAQTLLHILTTLPTPLIPVHCQTMCMDAEDRDAAFAVLEGVVAVHTNVLIGLMSVVRLCAPDAASDEKTVGRLVPAVFGSKAGIDDNAERKFVRLLLEG